MKGHVKKLNPKILAMLKLRGRASNKVGQYSDRWQRPVRRSDKIHQVDQLHSTSKHYPFEALQQNKHVSERLHINIVQIR